MSVTPKRKGLAKVLRVVGHKDMLVAEVTDDPNSEYLCVETLCFLNKTKQLWMLDVLEEGDLIGIELPLKQGRGSDPVTWALQNHDQPEALQRLNPLASEKVVTSPQTAPTKDLCSGQEVKFTPSKKVSGKLRNPETEKAFELLRSQRGINQSEAVEIAITEGLKALKALA